MQYDPIKKSLGNVFNRHPLLRKLFYRLMDLLLLRTWHIKKQLRIWKKNTGNDIQILDAGSGFGQYSYSISNMNSTWKITGLDVKTEQIEDCNNFFSKIKRNDRVHFEYADLTQFVKPETYQLVLCVDVMEHILEDVQVFKNYHVSMKKGGMLLISTPSDQGGSDAHDEHEDSFIDEHVRNGYNIEEIREKLKTAGFSKIEAKYTYGTPGNISWKLSMKFPIIMLNKSKLFFILLPLYYFFTYPLAFILNYFDLNGTHVKGTGLLVKAFK